jgi:hypothetical protein
MPVNEIFRSTQIMTDATLTRSRLDERASTNNISACRNYIAYSPTVVNDEYNWAIHAHNISLQGSILNTGILFIGYGTIWTYFFFGLPI